MAAMASSAVLGVLAEATLRQLADTQQQVRLYATRTRERARAREREAERGRTWKRGTEREREERQEPSAWTLAVLEKTVFFLLKKSAGVWRVLSFASPRARARLATRLPMPPPWRKHRVGAHRLQTVQENRTRSLQAISTQQDQCTTTAKDAPGPSPDTPA